MNSAGHLSEQNSPRDRQSSNPATPSSPAAASLTPAAARPFLPANASEKSEPGSARDRVEVDLGEAEGGEGTARSKEEAGGGVGGGAGGGEVRDVGKYGDDDFENYEEEVNQISRMNLLTNENIILRLKQK